MFIRLLHSFLEPTPGKAVWTFFLWTPLLPEVWLLATNDRATSFAASFADVFIIGPLYYVLAQIVLYVHFPPFLLFDYTGFFSAIVIALLIVALFWSYVFATLIAEATNYLRVGRFLKMRPFSVAIGMLVFFLTLFYMMLMMPTFPTEVVHCDAGLMRCISEFGRTVLNPFVPVAAIFFFAGLVAGNAAQKSIAGLQSFRISRR